MADYCMACGKLACPGCGQLVERRASSRQTNPAYVIASVALGAIALTVALPFIGLVALVRFAHRPRQAKPIRSVARVMTTQVAFRGIARARGETMVSMIDGAPMLVEQVAIYRGRRAPIRRASFAELWLEQADGRRVIVTGAMQIGIDTQPRRRIAADDPILDRLNIPVKDRSNASIASATIHPGDPITVVGEPHDERAPELDSYREAGEITVLRGRPDAPVSILL